MRGNNAALGLPPPPQRPRLPGAQRGDASHPRGPSQTAGGREVPHSPTSTDCPAAAPHRRLPTAATTTTTTSPQAAAELVTARDCPPRHPPPSQLEEMFCSMVKGTQKKAMRRSLSAREQMKMLVTVLMALLRVTT